MTLTLFELELEQTFSGVETYMSRRQPSRLPSDQCRCGGMEPPGRAGDMQRQNHRSGERRSVHSGEPI